MEERAEKILKERLDETQYKKIITLENPTMHNFVARYIELLNPDSIFIGTDRPEDIEYIPGRE